MSAGTQGPLTCAAVNTASWRSRRPGRGRVSATGNGQAAGCSLQAWLCAPGVGGCGDLGDAPRRGHSQGGWRTAPVFPFPPSVYAAVLHAGDHTARPLQTVLGQPQSVCLQNPKSVSVDGVSSLGPKGPLWVCISRRGRRGCGSFPLGSPHCDPSLPRFPIRRLHLWLRPKMEFSSI